MKVLVELRPAFQGHAGIPQESRLLFRGLGRLPNLEVQGLIQSSDRFIGAGLSQEPTAEVQVQQSHEHINLMSRVVVSLQPPISSHRIGMLSRALQKFKRLANPAKLLLSSILGLKQRLTWFDPAYFQDFIWRSFFSKTLAVDDLQQVVTARFRVARAPYGAMHACGLSTFNFGHAVYPRLSTRGIDVMLVLTPYPARVSRGTALVVRYFDAVPLLMPHTIINKAHHQALHYQALRLNVASGAYFACCSDATRRDLLAVFPEAENRALTIPCMLSHHYYAEESSPKRVSEVLGKRLNPEIYGTSEPGKNLPIHSSIKLGMQYDYILMVSTLEPRKNHSMLIEAWESLRSDGRAPLKLVFVGSLGWDHETIVERMRIWISSGEIYLLSGVPAEELRLLYRHAKVTVCPSLAEGFGYGGVEAMRCGGVVVASDIPVHREVYADAAEYFSPYSPSEAIKAIASVIDAAGLEKRRQLLAAGARVSEAYLPERVLPQWRALFSRLQRR